MDVKVLRSPETLRAITLFAGIVAAVLADAVRLLRLTAVRSRASGTAWPASSWCALLPAVLAAFSGYGHGSSFLSWLGAGAFGAVAGPNRALCSQRQGPAFRSSPHCGQRPCRPPAKRLHGEPQNDRFADSPSMGKRAAVVEVNSAILFIESRMALDVRILDLSTEDIEVQFEILRNVGQAAAALRCAVAWMAPRMRSLPPPCPARAGGGVP